MLSLQELLYGFSVALTFQNLAYCLVGVLLGTLVGVLPGVGPAAAIALLFPSVMHIEPVSSLILLAGLFYGAQYGGSTTSILLNMPGEATSVVTCLDGYQMAREGRAGPALGIAAFGSFIAGTLATLGLALLSPVLAGLALRFGPFEFFSLTVMAVTLVTYLSRGPLLRALMMIPLGLVLASVGMDPHSGDLRFTYGVLALKDGIGIVPVVMGLFGISEVIQNVGTSVEPSVLAGRIRNLFPNRTDWSRSKWPILRGTTIGFLLGLLPGIGVASTFLSYSVEKRLSKRPEEFGRGAIEGVAGPESCNNAAGQASFVPMLSLGLPTNVIMAMLLGAMMIKGIQPGPFLIKEHPDVFWGLISSMYVGNCMLLVLNLPLIPLWVQILRIPYAYLFPTILVFCVVGAYSLNNSFVDVVIMVLFGAVGYLLRIFRFDPAPLVLAMILGPLLEDNLRQALLISKGSFLPFATRPISCALLALTGLILLTSLLRLRPPKELLDESVG